MRTPLWAGLSCLALAACDSGISQHLPEQSGPFLGAVTLTESPSQFSAEANFTTAPFAAEVSYSPTQFAATGACPGSVVGACCLYAQPQLTIQDGDVEPATFNAGLISIADGADALASFNFAGYGYHPLSSAQTPALQWSAGDTLAVTSSGGAAAAFNATIAAPPAFASVQPEISPLVETVVKLSRDFTVSWAPAPGASGNVALELFDVNGFYVDCAAPDASGSVTVPMSTFGDFTALDNGQLTLARSVSTSVQSGNDTVAVTAVAAVTGNLTFLP